MDAAQFIKELAAGPAIIRALVADLPADAVTVRPAPDAWSIRDVACHLLDEERFDFRPRLDALLHQPGAPLPPNAAVHRVAARDYETAALGATLDAWEAERTASLAWLAGLQNPDFEASAEVRWGTLRAGDVLVSWAAHDTFHQRQIVRLRYRRLQEMAAPYNLAYAGDW